MCDASCAVAYEDETLWAGAPSHNGSLSIEEVGKRWPIAWSVLHYPFVDVILPDDDTPNATRWCIADTWTGEWRVMHRDRSICAHERLPKASVAIDAPAGTNPSSLFGALRRRYGLPPRSDM